MKLNLDDRSERLRFISTLVLVVGFLCAVVIYWRADQAATNPLGDQEDSKQYMRQMELYGGKANVLASDTRQWLVGLFHGRSLALTVVAMAVVVAAGFRFAAIPLPPGAETGRRRGGGSGG
jgi:hypothetical protein